MNKKPSKKEVETELNKLVEALEKAGISVDPHFLIPEEYKEEEKNDKTDEVVSS